MDLVFYLLHLALVILACALILLNVLDVISTNMALKQPGIIEIGDTALGLGNLAGWAQKTFGMTWWWIIKIPFMLPIAAMIFVTAPTWALIVFPPVLFLIDWYFYRIVRQNFINATPTVLKQRN